MPSPFSHGVASLAMGKAYSARSMPLRFWILTLVCATLPDIDVLGSHLGIGSWGVLGHRGITHSLLFAAIIGGFVVVAFFKDPPEGINRKSLFFYFFLVAASHGILDALVDGVMGVAFFAPFSSVRYFFPWKPIHSSPIGMGFFSSTGITVMLNEIVWVWIPSIAVILARIAV